MNPQCQTVRPNLPDCSSQCQAEVGAAASSVAGRLLPHGGRLIWILLGLAVSRLLWGRIGKKALHPSPALIEQRAADLGCLKGSSSSPAQAIRRDALKVETRPAARRCEWFSTAPPWRRRVNILAPASMEKAALPCCVLHYLREDFLHTSVLLRALEAHADLEGLAGISVEASRVNSGQVAKLTGCSESSALCESSALT